MTEQDERLADSSDARSSSTVNIWFRLGIHFLCGIVFPIFFGAIVAIRPGRAGATAAVEAFTKMWLQGNLALWALSTVLPDRWLTSKHVLVGIPLLNFVAFLVFLLLG